ncbi:hypothetical protein [Flavobacterium sp. W20_MBD1_R3]|uniref:hypothetical protein n=1 Tax=Flavobacterium sp. W20_MBD1_R3 TaxID=3240278 RepID=UPI003F92A2F0
MQNQSQINGQQQSNTNTEPTVVAAGMNPPHGQTGHRCDIAVGAPLNSPAANVAATPQQNTVIPASASTTTQPETTITAEGMNPPHGQTNHRCDIAVGAPLPK